MPLELAPPTVVVPLKQRKPRESRRLVAMASNRLVTSDGL